MSTFESEDYQGTQKIVSNQDVILEADRDQDGVGDLVFRTGGVERARIDHAGTGTGWANVIGGSLPLDPTVSPYNCVFDGVTDDYAGLAAAAADAVTQGRTLRFPSEKTAIVGTTLTLASQIEVDMSGSTIKKKATLAAPAVLASGANVQLRDGVIDGNKAGGATGDGLQWTGAGGYIEGILAQNNTAAGAGTGNGIAVTAGDLTIGPRVQALSNGSCGIRAKSGGKIVCEGTPYLALNGSHGMLLAADAADLCVARGYSYNNTLNGLLVNCNRFDIAEWLTRYDLNSGVVISATAGNTPTGGRLGLIRGSRTGYTTSDVVSVSSATTLVISGADAIQVDTVESRFACGYAFSAHGGISGTIPSTNIEVGTVIGDNKGATENDPCVSITHGSTVKIGVVESHGHTCAISIGEGFTPATNIADVGAILSDNCTYGIVKNEGGILRVGRVIDTDSYIDTATSIPLTSASLGLLHFASATTGQSVAGSRIGWFEHYKTGTSRNAGATTKRPIYGAYCDASASGVTVVDGFGTDLCSSATQDDNGANDLFLRRPKRKLQLASLDANETWTISGGTISDDTTAGHYTEGSGGKLVTPTGAGTACTASATVSSKDISAIGASDWLQVSARLSNVSDASGSNALRVRIGSDASNYLEIALPAAEMILNGTQTIKWRKGDMTTTGSPNLAAITYAAILLRGATPTISGTFDDLVWLDPALAESQRAPAVDTSKLLIGSGYQPRPQVTSGYGSPEGVVTAVPGSLYLRIDGATEQTVYEKGSGVGNTGWILLSPKSLPELRWTGIGCLSEQPDIGGCSTSTALASGTVAFVLHPVRAGVQINGVAIYTSAAGTALTLLKSGLYDTAESPSLHLANSNDFKASVVANTWLLLPFTQAYTPTADGYLYSAVLCTATTTPISMMRALSQAASGAKVNSGLRTHAQTAGQTDLTGNMTLADSATFWSQRLY